MESLKLYEISTAYRQLAERLADMDMDATTVADTLEASGLTDALPNKAQGVEMVARAAEMYCPIIDAEIARLQALKARRQKIAHGLRDYLKLNMENAGVDRIECELFTLTLKKNPPAVEVLEDKQIPAHFWVTPEPKPAEPRIDKTAIKAAIKAGIEVPGARMVQHTRLEVT
jgi:hypothetical protein